MFAQPVDGSADCQFILVMRLLLISNNKKSVKKHAQPVECCGGTQNRFERQMTIGSALSS